MTLKEQISKDYMEAFKQKNSLKKTLLSVVKGDIQSLEKKENIENLSDTEVLKILNKMAKSLKESLSYGNEEAQAELDIISQYLPKQMSESEIREKVQSLIDSGVNNMGGIMKEFLIEEWKNVSLMVILFAITIYLMNKGEIQVVTSTILPMLAIGLNLTAKK